MGSVCSRALQEESIISEAIHEVQILKESLENIVNKVWWVE